MIARKYTKRIQIFTSDTAPDGFGGNIATELNLGSFWAEVKQLSSFRDNSLGKADIKTGYSFKIRATGWDVDANIEIEYKGKRYIVNQINYDDMLFRELTFISNGG